VAPADGLVDADVVQSGKVRRTPRGTRLDDDGAVRTGRECHTQLEVHVRPRLAANRLFVLGVFHRAERWMQRHHVVRGEERDDGLCTTRGIGNYLREGRRTGPRVAY